MPGFVPLGGKLRGSRLFQNRDEFVLLHPAFFKRAAAETGGMGTPRRRAGLAERPAARAGTQPVCRHGIELSNKKTPLRQVGERMSPPLPPSDDFSYAAAHAELSTSLRRILPLVLRLRPGHAAPCRRASRLAGTGFVPRAQGRAFHSAGFAEESPHIRDFFVRLADTTGQSVGQAFLDKLDPARGRLIRLYSPAVAAPLAALKRLDPGRALEHMEAFQAAFYGGGQDVLNPDVQRELAVGLGADPAAFSAALAAPDLPERVQAEMDEAAAIMGEFALYPTLYLEDGASRRLLARGFAPYEQVAAKLADAASAPVLGPVCTLDGHCD